MPKGMRKAKRLGRRELLMLLLYISGLRPLRPQPARRVGGNVFADTPYGIEMRFQSLAKIRPSVGKPFVHYVIRLVKGQTLEDAQWEEIADEFLRRLGYTALHPRTYYIHDDVDGQHVHIAAGRIPMGGGKLYWGQNENLIASRVLDELGEAVGLKLSTAINAPAASDGRRDIPQKYRYGPDAPAVDGDWIRLQDDIDEVIAMLPTLPDFAAEMFRRGSRVGGKLGRNGRLLGLSFHRGQISAKGIELGPRFAFANLLARGLDYDEDRDADFVLNKAFLDVLDVPGRKPRHRSEPAAAVDYVPEMDFSRPEGEHASKADAANTGEEVDSEKMRPGPAND